MLLENLIVIGWCRNYLLLAITRPSTFLISFSIFVEKGTMEDNLGRKKHVFVFVVWKLCIRFVMRFLGNGLFSILDYDTWKPRRKLYDPVFNKRSSAAHTQSFIFVINFWYFTNCYVFFLTTYIVKSPEEDGAVLLRVCGCASGKTFLSRQRK